MGEGGTAEGATAEAGAPSERGLDGTGPGLAPAAARAVGLGPKANAPRRRDGRFRRSVAPRRSAQAQAEGSSAGDGGTEAAETAPSLGEASSTGGGDLAPLSDPPAAGEGDGDEEGEREEAEDLATAVEAAARMAERRRRGPERPPSPLPGIESVLGRRRRHSRASPQALGGGSALLACERDGAAARDAQAAWVSRRRGFCRLGSKRQRVLSRGGQQQQQQPLEGAGEGGAGARSALAPWPAGSLAGSQAGAGALTGSEPRSLLSSRAVLRHDSDGSDGGGGSSRYSSATSTATSTVSSSPSDAAARQAGGGGGSSGDASPSSGEDAAIASLRLLCRSHPQPRLPASRDACSPGDSRRSSSAGSARDCERRSPSPAHLQGHPRKAVTAAVTSEPPPSAPSAAVLAAAAPAYS
jgi:hypothetical protein